MLHGANGLGVAGEIRKGACARNTLPVRARYTPRLYVSMTGKALHRLTTRRHRNANFPWRGVREPGPKRKVFVGFAFWRLRHQRRRAIENPDSRKVATVRSQDEPPL